MYYGVEHPDRLRSLILCSTTASAKAFDEMRTNYMALRTEADQAALNKIGNSEAFNNGSPDAWAEFWGIWFHTYFADPKQVERMDLFFPPNTIKNCGAVAGLVLGSIDDFDLHDKLSAVSCPTLIMHGKAAHARHLCPTPPHGYSRQ